MAAQLASQAILAAASRSGLALSPDVAAVARSAGDVARVLVAGDPRTTGADYLTRDWEDLLLPPPDPPAPSHRLLSAGRAGGHREEQPTSGTRPASLETRG